MNRGGGGSSAAPTGCFKCGRPGHWSRDCPSTPSPNTDSASRPSFPLSHARPPPTAAAEGNAPAIDQKTKKKAKAPRTRPKLTPELLLSEDGLGYVLRHFPKAFKYHGRGHEVADLGNLIGLYAEWHSHLIPYYSFEQFVKKVEKVGSTARVRRCIAELRERVANGGDLSKLHEPPSEQVTSECEPEGAAGYNNDGNALAAGTNGGMPQANSDIMPNIDINAVQEDMLNEIYEKATEDQSGSVDQGCSEPTGIIASARAEAHEKEILCDHSKDQPIEEMIASAAKQSKIALTEEQRARMEANRLKALERAAAARVRSSQA